MMGHTRTAITQDLYTHVSAAMRRSAADVSTLALRSPRPDDAGRLCTATPSPNFQWTDLGAHLPNCGKAHAHAADGHGGMSSGLCRGQHGTPRGHPHMPVIASAAYRPVHAGSRWARALELEVEPQSVVEFGHEIGRNLPQHGADTLDGHRPNLLGLSLRAHAQAGGIGG